MRTQETNITGQWGVGRYKKTNKFLGKFDTHLWYSLTVLPKPLRHSDICDTDQPSVVLEKIMFPKEI